MDIGTVVHDMLLLGMKIDNGSAVLGEPESKWARFWLVLLALFVSVGLGLCFESAKAFRSFVIAMGAIAAYIAFFTRPPKVELLDGDEPFLKTVELARQTSDFGYLVVKWHRESELPSIVLDGRLLVIPKATLEKNV